MSDPQFYELRKAILSSYDAAQALLDADPGAISARDGVGETVMHWFAVENQLEIVSWLFNKGSDVNNRTDFGDTPISEAASLGLLEMCQYLLSVGADPSIVNDQGHSALGAAAISDKVDVVRLLLKHLPDDVDVNKHLNPISRNILLDRNSESGQLLIQLGLQIKGDV